MSSLRKQEGFIPVGDGYRVWYQIVGGGAEQEQIPILTVHGGPGVPHDYIEDMADLASASRRVIFYDQLGCGRSDCPDNPALWTIERSVGEIGIVRQALGLDKVHLWGQSFGGLFSIEYALQRPQGLVSLTLASSTSSIPLWVAEANRLRQDLPPDVQATLLRHEQAGTTDDPAYQQAAQVFNERHVLRLKPVPEHVQRANEQTGQVYYIMNGPSEFHVIGVIKDWDRTNRLGEIRVPTLITSGRYDESTPLINEVLHRGIVDSLWVIFEQSAHLAHVEERSLYMATMRAFLTRVEAQSK
ncbi:alpha/beta fold hydrolase [Ktedonosporobacter rubrisoli]|uniref:Proline iminopeptidase n=1 Tax=Ktedonosporobacter rubrisoli TaxID=2509675 RepID=A0A4P6K0F1_KTERU|nr:proline iminopeptidase-family hydrolase [Ktedonosporobacter rubrisoli]QBD81252.1 alpha/beta fold hydrolase [Ktedonosporobacter rubrisoli]